MKNNTFHKFLAKPFTCSTRQNYIFLQNIPVPACVGISYSSWRKKPNPDSLRRTYLCSDPTRSELRIRNPDWGILIRCSFLFLSLSVFFGWRSDKSFGTMSFFQKLYLRKKDRLGDPTRISWIESGSYFSPQISPSYTAVRYFILYQAETSGQFECRACSTGQTVCNSTRFPFFISESRYWSATLPVSPFFFESRL